MKLVVQPLGNVRISFLFFFFFFYHMVVVYLLQGILLECRSGSPCVLLPIRNNVDPANGWAIDGGGGGEWVETTCLRGDLRGVEENGIYDLLGSRVTN